MSFISVLAGIVRGRREFLGCGVLGVAVALGSCSARSQSDVEVARSALVSSNQTVTQAADESRTGWYPDQPSLDSATVGGPNFKRLFKTTLPLTPGELVLAQPLVDGGKVLVATEANNLYSLDENSGVIVAQRALGPAFSPNANGITCWDLQPTVGITGTPVIDPATGTAYLYSKSDSGQWTLHAVSTADLSERPGFPVTIGGRAQNDASVEFDSRIQHQRPGLLLLDGVVYAAFGAHCDLGAYRGWLFGVTTSGVVKSRFSTLINASSSGKGCGIWMSGAGLSSDGAGRIFFATGNGASRQPYPNPVPSGSPPDNLEEAVVRVDVQGDGSLKAADFFAPFNSGALNDADADLGSGGVVLLPSQFGSAAIPRTAAIAGKGGDLYLLNQDSLGGVRQGPAGGDAALSIVPLGGGAWSRLGVWPGDGGYVYVMTNGGTSTTGNRLQALKSGLTADGKPSLSVVARAPESFEYNSGSPIVTSNGLNSGSALVWVTNQTSELLVYDAVPAHGAMTLRFRDTYGWPGKYTTVGVGTGKVYVGSGDGHVIGYGVGAAPVTASPVAFQDVTLGESKTLLATIKATQPITITGLASSNAAFTLGTSSPVLPATLNTNESLTVPVTFTPTQATSQIASLDVSTSSGGGSVSLSGTGKISGPKLLTSPKLVNFGGVAVGASQSISVVLQNGGNQALTFAAFSAPAAPFFVSGMPAPGDLLAPGDSLTITTRYSPTEAVTSLGNLIVNSDGGSSNISLTGTSGAPPELVVTPLSIDFGVVDGGASAARSFSVKNVGGLDLMITKSKPPSLGKFSAQTPLAEGTVVKAGQTLTETVRFASTAVGAFSDTWLITGNDTSGLQTVTFSGSAVTAPMPLPRTGWIASASASWAGDLPMNALDGLPSRWSSGVTQSQDITQSFTVDMLSAQRFGQLSIDTGTDSASDFPRSYQVFASNDPANWGAPIASGTGSSAILSVSFPAQLARYLQIRQLSDPPTSSFWWSIAELNVFAAPLLPGAALDRSAWRLSASDTASGDEPARAIDGSSATRWSTGIAQSAAGTRTLTIDMTGAQTFDAMTIESGGDCARSFQLFASSDPNDWGSAIATGPCTATTTTLRFAPQTARYLQLRQLPSANIDLWWSIDELDVYAPGGAALQALPRAGWTVTTSESMESGANLLDGQIDSRWSSDAVQSNGQFVLVDMQATKTFRQMTLDSGANVDDYARGYQVYVSNDGLDFGNPVASGLGLSTFITITFESPQIARYVKVVQTGTTDYWWWSIAELNVYD